MKTKESEAAQNTDREIWRAKDGDYYSPSIHVTKQGMIGINVGGTVIVKSVEDWHSMALPTALAREKTEQQHSGEYRAEDWDE